MDLRLLTRIEANYYTPRIIIYNAQIIGVKWASYDPAVLLWPGSQLYWESRFPGPDRVHICSGLVRPNRESTSGEFQRVLQLDQANNLPNKIFVCIGARFMLSTNL